MNSLVVYSFALLFVRGLFAAEEHRIAHYVGQLRKMKIQAVTLRDGQVSVAV